MSIIENKNIILCVTGGIAAYKAVTLASMMTKAGANVYVIMSRHATQFVTPLTFKTITKQKVTVGMFDDSQFIPHISLSDLADLVVVAPATANIIAKAAAGIADDMISTLLVSSTAPKLIVPAMNTNMYLNPITQDNMTKLRKYGFHFTEPDSGRMACGTVGVGRYPENEHIFSDIINIIGYKKSIFDGKKVLITLGGTREAIDPVRFIGNRSSGTMGFAFAECFIRRGANVTIIAANTDTIVRDSFCRRYPNVTIINAESAAALKTAVYSEMPNNDILLMCAAVADYKPHYSDQKIKKSDGDMTIALSRTDDIIAGLPKDGSKLFIAFSAETQNVLDNAKGKLERKGVNYIVANQVCGEHNAMGGSQSELMLVTADGVTTIPYGDKIDNADKVLDLIDTLESKNDKSECQSC
ncbi:MAG: bifunctional phosphopantothenoylcysteine decarboxylase/phosphopantothenate--cysteine ligase CoaBC [Spirochaetales bacterium]|nr:bifunctional phosphopantothenoylcysteine decarboxylase/phosphopantothenate--cysteine ligase CoaBC [Spirochaetales bacterium]